MSDPSNAPSPGSLDDATAYIIHRTARILRFNLLRLFRRLGYDLTPEQWFVLYRLWERDGRSQTELSDSIFNDRPNITRIVDGLVRSALVERRTDANDRRKFLIYLTDKAKEYLQTLRPAILEERERLFSEFDTEELIAFRRMLLKVEKSAAER